MVFRLADNSVKYAPDVSISIKRQSILLRLMRFLLHLRSSPPAVAIPVRAAEIVVNVVVIAAFLSMSNCKIAPTNTLHMIDP